MWIFSTADSLSTIILFLLNDIMNNQSRLTDLKGIGEKTAGLFAKLHITNTEQLLSHYPRTYQAMEPPVPVSDLYPGKICAVKASIIGNPVTRKVKSLTITTVQAGDATGLFRITFFGMPYLKSVLKPGTTHIFRGMVEQSGKMEQPQIHKVEDYLAIQGSLQPIYSLTAGLTQKMIMKAVKSALEMLDQTQYAEFLPEEVLKKYHLISWKEAVRKIHCPSSLNEVTNAKNRLAFNEFLAFFINIHRMKQENHTRIVPEPLHIVSDTVHFLNCLPYQLTGAQKKVWKEIEDDLCNKTAMSRLVQGDVGSGKTILAFLALLMCAANGKQGCLMAPTEVLASQHYDTFLKMAEAYQLCVKPVLLTGSQTAKEKREIYKKIADGTVNVIIGTHALIQNAVQYKNLALVVTDEQHRFGVRQRETLADKGDGTHVLVMSATPIPRTLAIVLYGDLQVSIVDELPSGRLPIKNCVVGTSYRPKAYAFIKKQVESGHQVYCICPMVEEGEMEGLENVIEYTEKLRAALPDSIHIEYLHGKMKPAEKNRIMDEFASGQIQVLVSTTVIEVGINVPNATVMMVENAERFGLAQLHQLRGRVGRGDAQSYCIFISGNENEQIMKRLQILNHSNDGFHIANEDLKLRGPGDLFGVRQSGLMDFQIGDIYQDSDLLLKASSLAEQVINADPDEKNSKYQLIFEWMSQTANPIDFRGA